MDKLVNDDNSDDDYIFLKQKDKLFNMKDDKN